MFRLFCVTSLWAACCVGVSTVLRADEATIVASRLDLFRGGDGAYEKYRIPGVVVSAKGTVIVYCEGRKRASSDWGPIDILLRRSTDGGQTFSLPVTVADVPGHKAKNPVAVQQNLAVEGEVTYNNPVMIAEPDGKLHLLFCLNTCAASSPTAWMTGSRGAPPKRLPPRLNRFARNMIGRSWRPDRDMASR